jgi:site-specific DNA recombinase
VLSASGPAAAHALRALVGGKIVVTEVRRPGRKRHYLRARFELRLRNVAGLIGAGTIDAASLDETVDVVEIDIRRPERHEVLADEAKRLWDDGKTDKQIAKLLGCGRGIVKKALDFWYERQGLKRPDGRSTRKRLKGRRKADQLQSEIMLLWHQDLSVNAIAERLDVCLEIVHEAVTKWHLAQDLPVPDGRARRREIRLRRREAG